MSTAAVRLQRRASEGDPACVWQLLVYPCPPAADRISPHSNHERCSCVWQVPFP